METTRCLRVDLGIMDFSQAWNLQKRLAHLRMEGKLDDLLLLAEHPPVVTIGRAGDPQNICVPLGALEERGISLVEVDRGGDVTYHGPGQLVGYPILDLTFHGRDLHLYVHNLEEHLIQLLASYGVHACRLPGLVGVWVAGKKIAAIGVHVKKWITTHGYALNISPRMDHFDLIHQCGLRGRRVTALAPLIGRDVPMAEVRERAAAAFSEVFKVHLEKLPLEQILSQESSPPGSERLSPVAATGSRFIGEECMFSEAPGLPA